MVSSCDSSMYSDNTTTTVLMLTLSPLQTHPDILLQTIFANIWATGEITCNEPFHVRPQYFHLNVIIIDALKDLSMYLQFCIEASESSEAN